MKSKRAGIKGDREQNIVRPSAFLSPSLYLDISARNSSAQGGESRRYYCFAKIRDNLNRQGSPRSSFSLSLLREKIYCWIWRMSVFMYFMLWLKVKLSCSQEKNCRMTGEWEEEIFFPKRRDPEDYVVNTVVRKTACRILSFSLKIDQGKSAQLIRSLISPSLVVKSHGGDKIFIIDSYIVIVAIKFNRDPVLFFYNLYASCHFLFNDDPRYLRSLRYIHRLSIRE